MKTMSIIALCSLLLAISAYSIEGQWQATDYNNTKALVSAVSTGSNGLNNYKIQIDGCTSTPSFTVS